MKRTKEEVVSKIRAYIGEEPDDAGLEILEDVSDTFTDYETRMADTTDWKAKYEENDKKWRRTYAERFDSSYEDSYEPDKDIEEVNKMTKYEELFS